jgi:hypothetical protein
MISAGFNETIMAGLGPAINVFAFIRNFSRGCRRQARA